MTRLRHALDLAARTGFWRDAELWGCVGLAAGMLMYGIARLAG